MFITCTINGDNCEVSDSPVTFAPVLATVDSVDTIQFENGEVPSGPNCSILFNNFVLCGTCVYEYRPI